MDKSTGVAQRVRITLSISRDLESWAFSVLSHPGPVALATLGMMESLSFPMSLGSQVSRAHSQPGEGHGTPCSQPAKNPQLGLDATQHPWLDTQSFLFSCPLLLLATRMAAHCSLFFPTSLPFTQAVSSLGYALLLACFPTCGPDQINRCLVYLALSLCPHPPQRTVLYVHISVLPKGL